MGETPIAGWRQAVLLKPSFIKPILATVSRGIVPKRLGRLPEADDRLLGDALRIWLGPA